MADIGWIPGVGYMGGAKAPENSLKKIGYLGESDREVKSEMGKEDFLQLLAAQMQYQNPLEPMNDTDFTAQLAQFSSLESLTNMSTAINSMVNYQAYSLVGQYVLGEVYVDGVLQEIAGPVDCVYTQEGVTYAQIGDYSIPVDSINTVLDKELVAPQPDMTLVGYSNLIGRGVTARIAVDGEYKDVSGTVTRVAAERDGTYAHIDDGSEEGVWVTVGSIYDIKTASDTSDITLGGGDGGDGGEKEGEE